MARVAVVDNSPEFLDLIDTILKADRHDTTLIDPDREGALQLIRESAPDVLMVDVPIGDGAHAAEVAQRVRGRSEFDGLPVLVCSADKQLLSEIAASLAVNRPVGTLAMPFGIDELTEAIDRLLNDGARSRPGGAGELKREQTHEKEAARTVGVNRTDFANISQIQPGWKVYTSDGQEIGDVAEVAISYIVVEMDFLVRRDLYVPASAIASVTSDRVELSMPKDAVDAQEWDAPPDEMIPGDAYFSPDFASVGGTDGTHARPRKAT
jgi:CheY-like chemotaxis protein